MLLTRKGAKTNWIGSLTEESEGGPDSRNTLHMAVY